ncbi:MAG: hypothetical protein ACRDFS_05135 [Chloroflexota bacterium]
MELHVHLEGTMQPATVLGLADKNNIKLPAASLGEMEAHYRYTTFLHFIETYQLCAGYLQTAEDFAQITWEFLRGQAAQNVVYSEVMVER